MNCCSILTPTPQLNDVMVCSVVNLLCVRIPIQSVFLVIILKLVKSFVLLIWETRKKELYGDQDCVVSGCSCSCPLTGGLTSSACVCGCVVNGVSATAAT